MIIFTNESRVRGSAYKSIVFPLEKVNSFSSSNRKWCTALWCTIPNGSGLHILSNHHDQHYTIVFQNSHNACHNDHKSLFYSDCMLVTWIGNQYQEYIIMQDTTHATQICMHDISQNKNEQPRSWVISSINWESWGPFLFDWHSL